MDKESEHDIKDRKDDQSQLPKVTKDLLADVKSLSELGRVFFVGIGGAGMSVLASMLNQSGIPVAGSDREQSPTTERLSAVGIEVHIGQKAENIQGFDTIVRSSAIPEDSPEIQEALRLKLRIVHRSDILALFIRLYKSVAVSGTHGKTTTTAMIAMIMAAADITKVQKSHGLYDPSFVIGSCVKTDHGIVPGGYIGTGEWLIAEADESDRSYQKYHPLITVVTNADGDHFDHYKDIGDYCHGFMPFVENARDAVVMCGDDNGCRVIYDELPESVRAHTYVYATQPYEQISGAMKQLDSDHFVHIDSIKQFVENESDPGEVAEIFELKLPSITRLDGTQTRPGSVEVQLKIPGIYNARNAAAAIITTILTGFSPIQAARAAIYFLGATRRFDFQGEVNNIRLYNDYSHHPSEIEVFLQTVRQRFPRRTVRVLFQPHTFSRTQTYKRQLIDALALADEVFICDIYAAREKPQDYPGISAAILGEYADDCGLGDKFHYIGNQVEAAVALADHAESGDILATIGAGNIDGVDDQILKDLRLAAKRRKENSADISIASENDKK